MKRQTFILILLMLSCMKAMSQEAVPFSPEKWTVYGGEIIEFEGKTALKGTALLKNYQFENGTIEWEMYTTGQRSYPGIFFRMNEKRDYEHFYVRPHKVNGLNADALQYTPAYHNVSCWQLYHGEGYTKAAVIPVNEWVHYKLVVYNDQAKVFIGDMREESLTIHNLEHGISSGAVILNSPADGSAYFADFSMTTEITCSFGRKRQKPIIPGAINHWEVSEPITNNHIDNQIYPGGKFLDALKWKPVNADAYGKVNLTQAVVREPFQPSWVYAKVDLHSETEKPCWYTFGYSDYITVFFNGEPIFQGVNAYTSRDPSYAGLIGYFDSVKLKLKEGNNELILLLGEQFGGWGFMFRDAEKELVSEPMSKSWEIRNQLNYPESAVWDSKRQVIYVSNYLRGQSEYISKVSIDGKIIEKEWITGIKRPTGLLLLKDRLLVVERKSLVMVDVETASIDNRIAVEGAVFLNDIAAANEGETIFISDSAASRIYKIENDQASVWMQSDDILKPNALTVDGKRLLVGCMGDSALKSIDMETGEVASLVELFPGAVIDGIQVLGDRSILFGDFNGILYKWDKEGRLHEMINSSGTNINFSNFIFIKEKDLIVIPGLNSNSLSAYRLSEK